MPYGMSWDEFKPNGYSGALDDQAPREAYEDRPFVCDWCGYRVNHPCKSKRDRSNCENS